MLFVRHGRRVEKRVLNASGTRTLRERYVYVGYTCVQILNGDGGNAVVKEFVWDPTEPVATRPLMFGYASKEKYLFYMFDGNKNVSDVFYFALGNGVGAHYEYAPFGAITRTATSTRIGNVDIVADNPFRFSSEYYDPELDLVYYNYRHYSPLLGRFLSRDPIEEQGGLNLYAFYGNAIQETDALGLMIAPGSEIWHPLRPRQETVSKDDPVISCYKAVKELWEAYEDMRTANTIGADKYFHCIGMCKATRKSDRALVVFLAKLREVSDLLRKGVENGFKVPLKNAEDSLKDMEANMKGIDCPGDKTCEECCCEYKVKGR